MAKLICSVILFFFFFSVLVSNFHISTETFAWSKVDYPQENLKKLLRENDLDEELYYKLFLQTGLGKDAIDAVVFDVFDGKNFDKKNNKPTSALAEELNKYQNDFFADREIECEKIGIITYQEHLVNVKGKKEKNFNIADLKDGDVLITKNTHSLGWRHGHSALVIDGKGGKTLEAVLWGQPSSVQNIEKWQDFPTFILLRPKEKNMLDTEKIVDTAISEMNGVTYGLLTGIPFKAPKQIKKTQCAHVIWYPYFKEGVDIDYDGGWLVTPKDIANSDFFDVVQVYGVNPKNIWK